MTNPNKMMVSARALAHLRELGYRAQNVEQTELEDLHQADGGSTLACWRHRQCGARFQSGPVRRGHAEHVIWSRGGDISNDHACAAAWVARPDANGQNSAGRNTNIDGGVGQILERGSVLIG